jgi:hypothetical protein
MPGKVSACGHNQPLRGPGRRVGCVWFESVPGAAPAAKRWSVIYLGGTALDVVDQFAAEADLFAKWAEAGTDSGALAGETGTGAILIRKVKKICEAGGSGHWAPEVK